LNHLPLFILLDFTDFDEFQMQIRNTVSAMKIDFDAITNRVSQIELKLNEVIYKFILYTMNYFVTLKNHICKIR